jgi:regulator of protease activity HflC (stomatin/prohibitin superfamily)
MGEGTVFLLVVFGAIVVMIFKGVKIVPQQQAWIVENLGKFKTVLQPGLNFIIPFIDRVAYKHSLKEEAIDVHSQTAITMDNVTLQIDGVLYVRIIDPRQASYGVADPYFALIQLAQTTMRSEIGQISMDNTFSERDSLNANIVQAINEAAAAWGIQCMRYEIKDINPPLSVKDAMERQVTAEREKRASVLQSEGDRQSAINVAEGQKQQVVLASEGAMTDQINRAKGEANAIESVAIATANGIREVAQAIGAQGGSEAVSLRIAEQYVKEFGNLAKEGNTILLPANVGDAAGMTAQALAVFESIRGSRPS